jgi:hypothetical protein
MGGIHPRSKKPVGDRLGTATLNTVYDGKEAYTGPTLAGCSLGGATAAGAAASLIIDFNASARLSGDAPFRLKPIKPATAHTGLKTYDERGDMDSFTEHSWALAPSRSEAEAASFGGSTLYVQVPRPFVLLIWNDLTNLESPY